MTAIDGPGRGTDRGAGSVAKQARWTSIALRLFPDAWQERFGAEFGALLDQTPPTPRVLFDVVVAAVDAHVHPTGPRRRWPLMIERLRISELVVFASWVAFVVAGLAFQRLTEDGPLGAARQFQGTIAIAYAAIIGGAVVSLGAIAVAGIPIAVAIARQAIHAGDRRQLGLLAVPIVSLLMWVGLTVGVLAFDVPYESPWQLVLFLVWTGTFGLAALVSTVALSAAALEADLNASLYRRAPSRRLSRRLLWRSSSWP